MSGTQTQPTQTTSHPSERDPLLNSRQRSRPPYNRKSERNAQRICNFLRILSVVLVICTFLVLHGRQGSEGYIIYNANIYTVDEQHPRIESFVVLDGKFVDVGTRLDLLKRWTGLQHIDLQGRTVVPGFIDAHAHLTHLGDTLYSVDLSGAKSIKEVHKRIRTYISTHRNKSEWIMGWGWDQTQWSSKSFPTSRDLDSDPKLARYPIALSRVDGHALWVNERILDILRKDRIPDEIDGGEIGKEKGTNRLTGIFVDNAMDLVFEKQPPPTDEQLQARIKAAIYRMHSYGLTGIHDAGVTPDILNFYKKMITKSPEEFNIRNYAMVGCHQNSYCGDEVERIEGLGEGRLTVRSVKLFMDGALGSWGAALLEPYSDDPTKQGLLISDPTLLPPVINQWIEKGFQVNTHCIGDRANRIIIDTYEKSFRDCIKSQPNGGNLTDEELSEEVKRLAERLRFRIEHAQILTLDDIKRFGELNIIPSMQPTHATSDMSYAEQRLGSERVKGAYAWRSFINAGVKAFPLSSDFPVEHVNPFLGFYAAITRKWTNGDSPHGRDGWFPSEKLTREEALRGFTIDAAYAGFSEDILGSITKGKYADFVVIDRDIMEIPEEEIIGTTVLATVFGGKVVFGNL